MAISNHSPVTLSPAPGCLHSPPHFLCNSLACATCSSPSKYASVCAGGRRPRNQPRITVARLSIHGLKSLIQETENTLDLEVWQHCDILLFSGLDVAAGLCQLYESAQTFLAFLTEVRTRHPFLKLYFSFGAGVSEELEKYLGLEEFWRSLENCIQTCGFEGCELSLDFATKLTQIDDIQKQLLGFAFRQKTILTLPNNLKILQSIGIGTYKTLTDLVQYVNVNSYGFLKFDPIVKTEHGSLCKMLPAMESGLADFQKVCDWVLQFTDPMKLLGGMDTVALQYTLHSDDDYVKSIALVTSRDIETKKAGGEFVGQRRLHYIERYDDTQQASLMELKRARLVISYDNYRVRNAKLNYLRKYAGVVVGDLYYDLNVLHKHSLLRMVHSKLANRNTDHSLPVLPSIPDSEGETVVDDAMSVVAE
jgi:hypothetical protein